MEKAQQVLRNIVDNIETTIVGKRWTVELVVLCLASSGHVLIEDVPGVGKTSLAQALAHSVDCGFKRIQFTSDTLPSDITGYSVYNPKTDIFEFRPGAVMSNFILADEINRTTPKTQASLLEIMEESQVTVDTQTYALEQPFMVLATQNPIEFVGTYPLPEAQIDRFLLRVSMGYPKNDDEIRIITAGLMGSHKQLAPVANAKDIIEIRQETSQIYVDDTVKKYIVSITDATRSHRDILLGVSPRGSIALGRMCQAYALYSGRDYVIPDNVKLLAPYVLSHRLILTHESRIDKKKPESILEEILRSIPVPPAAWRGTAR